ADPQRRQDDHARVEHRGLDDARDPRVLDRENVAVLSVERHVQQARVEQHQQPGSRRDDRRPRRLLIPGQTPDVGDERPAFSGLVLTGNPEQARPARYVAAVHRLNAHVLSPPKWTVMYPCATPRSLGRSVIGLALIW